MVLEGCCSSFGCVVTVKLYLLMSHCSNASNSGEVLVVTLLSHTGLVFESLEAAEEG